MIEIEQLHPLFVAEVRGVDLRRPVEPETLNEIVAALDRHAVLVFRDQPLTDEQQIAFSALLGPLETTRQAMRPGHKMRLNPHMSDISNLDENSRIMSGDDYRRMSGLANRLWHTDSTYKRVPARYSLLSAHVVPSDGTTCADSREYFAGTRL